MEKAYDEVDNIPDNPDFAFLLFLKLLEFFVGEGSGIFLFIPAIVLFHGDALLPLASDQAFLLFLYVKKRGTAVGLLQCLLFFLRLLDLERFFFLGAGGEYHQGQHEDQNQGDNLFHSFDFLS